MAKVTITIEDTPEDPKRDCLVTAEFNPPCREGEEPTIAHEYGNLMLNALTAYVRATGSAKFDAYVGSTEGPNLMVPGSEAYKQAKAKSEAMRDDKPAAGPVFIPGKGSNREQ